MRNSFFDQTTATMRKESSHNQVENKPMTRILLGSSGTILHLSGKHRMKPKKNRLSALPQVRTFQKPVGPVTETEIVSFETAKPACPIAVHHHDEPRKTQFSPEKGLFVDCQLYLPSGKSLVGRVLSKPYDLTHPQFLEREAAFARAEQVRGSALVKDTISDLNIAEP